MKRKLYVSLISLFMIFPILSTTSIATNDIGNAISPESEVDLYVYNGRIPHAYTINIRIDSSRDSRYTTAWYSAYTYYNQNLQYRTFRSSSTAQSLMTSEFDFSRPNTFGRIIYQNSNSRYSTPFYTYLNEYKREIYDSANVRRSTASHELGHALGLADLTTDSYSIMNTKRNREVIIYPSAIDLMRINSLR